MTPIWCHLLSLNISLPQLLNIPQTTVCAAAAYRNSIVWYLQGKEKPGIVPISHLFFVVAWMKTSYVTETNSRGASICNHHAYN